MKKIKYFFILVLISVMFFSPNLSFGESESKNNELSEEELLIIENMLNKFENNGFLKSIYSKPSEIDLNEAIRGYFNKKGEININELAEDELEDIKTKLGLETIEIPLFKITMEELTDFYESKTGEELSNISNRLKYQYIEKYDAFYHMHGDTNYQEIKCISGIKDEDGKIIIKYKYKNGANIFVVDNNYIEAEVMKVTLKNTSDGYIFISNTVNKEEMIENNDDNKSEEKEDSELKTTERIDNTITKTILPKTGIASNIGILFSISIVCIVSLILLKKWK